MSDFDYDSLKALARVQARSTAVWDPRQCSRELWDRMMAEIPHDAVGADMTKHATHNAYSPKFWYRDEWFACSDCGKSEKWTAQAQRWWYEVARGAIYTQAVRCLPCRRGWREKSGRISHAERQAREQKTTGS